MNIILYMLAGVGAAVLAGLVKTSICHILEVRRSAHLNHLRNQVREFRDDLKEVLEVERADTLAHWVADEVANVTLTRYSYGKGEIRHRMHCFLAQCAAESEGLTLPPMLEVIRRPLLVSGQLRSRLCGGIPVILIDEEQSREEQLRALWHEVGHLLRTAGGYPHHEEDVEEAALRLAAACPEALDWVGLGEKTEPERP